MHTKTILRTIRKGIRNQTEQINKINDVQSLQSIH